MAVAVYGNYGMPIIAFPTSMGDEQEQEGQGMIRAGADQDFLHQRGPERFVQ